MSINEPLQYFDNAATSFPKPPEVGQAMMRHLGEQAVNPGRSGFDLSLEAGQAIDRIRLKVDRFFNNPAQDPNRNIFSANATDALNTALQGVCRPGDHVITTAVDHNSVLRPLHQLSKQGLITYDIAPADKLGRVDPGQVAKLMLPHTRLVAMTHASNVCGRVQSVAAIGRICRERGVLLLLDAAQTAGTWPVDMAALNVDLLAYTGHKGLLGPTGTGGLLVGPGVRIQSTRWGGTGVRSALESHLDEFPYRLESGTLNATGLAGLAAGLDWVTDTSIGAVVRHEKELANQLLEETATVKKIRWHGFADPHPRRLEGDQLPVLSCTIDGLDPAAVGMFLDADHNIAVRSGLQCAPLAHKALGTFERGTVRFGIGPFNSPGQIENAARALAHIAK